MFFLKQHCFKSHKTRTAEITQISHHVVVIICHCLIGASSSNAEAVRSTKIRFHLLVSFTRHFDMVAEQVRGTIIWCIQLVSRMITSKADTSKTTITSSGKEKRFKWDFDLGEGTEINMFAHDHRLNPKSASTNVI